jgi:hypothetical protein
MPNYWQPRGEKEKVQTHVNLYSIVFRVEEALDGFLSIQQQQRLAFAQSQSQSTSEENDGAKEEKGSGHSAKLRDYMLKVVEELAFRAASVLRDPQNGQK